jgi:hypothetical protein
MWNELFLLGVTLIAVLATFGAVIYRLERDYWRNEAEAYQDSEIKKGRDDGA